MPVSDIIKMQTAAAATGNGTAAAVADFAYMGMQVTGTFSGTVTFEGTIDDTNFVSLEVVNTATGAKSTTLTAAGVVTCSVAGLSQVRARVSAYVSGNITVTGLATTATGAPMNDLGANSGVDIGDVDVATINAVAPQFDDTDKIAVSLYGKASAAGDKEVLVDSAGHPQVDVLSITAGETHIGEVGGNSSVAEVTLTLDTSIYATGDVLADTQILTACMRVDQGTAVIHSFVLLDQDDQAQAMDILFLRTNVSIGTENSAVAVTDANADEILGVIEINTGDYVDLINSQIVCKSNVGIVVDAAAAADDLYIAAICRSGTPTYTASGITCKVGFLRD